MPRPALTKTKYDGVYYYTRNDEKVYIVKYKVHGRKYSKTIGSSKDPVRWNDKLAFMEREKLIDTLKHGKRNSWPDMEYDTLFNQYLESKRHSMSKSWYRNNFYAYGKHVKPYIGKHIVRNVYPDDVRSIINRMIAADLKPKTIKEIRDQVKVFYDYIAANNYTIHNPAANIELQKFDNQRTFTLSLPECQALYRTIIEYDNFLFRTVFIFLLHGRRKSEVLHMRWEYMDFENREYKVPYSINKAKKTMTYPITDLLYEALDNYGIKSNGLTFVSNRTGHQIRNGGMDYHWKKIKQLAGLTDKDIVIHDLRHLIGYISVNSGIPLEMIGKTLGHTSGAVTQRYSNVHLENVNKVLSNFFQVLDQ